MALTPEEVKKVNDLFNQIDQKDTQLEAKEKLLAEKEILLNKTRVALNEKQSVLTQKDAELEKLKQIVEENQKQMLCYKDVQQQLKNITEKIEFVLSKIPSTRKTPAKKSSKVTSRTTKSK